MRYLKRGILVTNSLLTGCETSILFSKTCIFARVLRALSLGVRVLAAQQPLPPLPPTPEKPVIDVYHGVKLTDDYQWLENWNNPAVRACRNGNLHSCIFQQRRP